jgi:hypothetical protein
MIYISLSCLYYKTKQNKNVLLPCIYPKRKDDSVINIALYVDDFFIFYNDNVEIQNLKGKLQQYFKIKDLGPVKKCLVIQ